MRKMEDERGPASHDEIATALSVPTSKDRRAQWILERGKDIFTLTATISFSLPFQLDFPRL